MTKVQRYLLLVVAIMAATLFFFGLRQFAQTEEHIRSIYLERGAGVAWQVENRLRQSGPVKLDEVLLSIVGQREIAGLVVYNRELKALARAGSIDPRPLKLEKLPHVEPGEQGLVVWVPVHLPGIDGEGEGNSGEHRPRVKGLQIVFEPITAQSLLMAGIAHEVRNPVAAVKGLGQLLLMDESDPESRFWCRYLCPLGGLVGLFNKLGSLRPGRKAETCISCHRCDRVCPTAVKITEREKITDSSCVSCLKCVDACPVPETLTIKSKGLFLVLGLLAFFLPPLITQVTGIWQSTPVAAEIEQINDPAQIKGWMTLEDVARAFGLDKNQLARELGLSEAETGEHLKEVMAEKGKDMDYLRAYIAEKLKEK